MFAKVLCGVTLAGAVGLFPVRAEAVSPKERELLEFARDAHRSAREQIRTANCRLRFTAQYLGADKKPRTQSCSVEYWFSPEAIRVKLSDSLGVSHELDYLWKNSQRQALITQEVGGKKEYQATLGAFAERCLHRCDAWARALLMLDDPGEGRQLYFEDLLEVADRIESVKRKSIGGRDMVVVELTFNKTKPIVSTWHMEVFLDASVNYLVRKVVYERVGGIRREAEVEKFQEFTGGVYFPVRVVGRAGDGFSSLAEFTDVSINEPLPRDIFEFRYPHGVTLYDGIRNARYRVDESGNPISEMVPLSQEPVPPPLTDLLNHQHFSETLQEPRSWTRWILPVSLGILAAAAVGYGIRWWRRRWHTRVPY